MAIDDNDREAARQMAENYATIDEFLDGLEPGVHSPALCGYYLGLAHGLKEGRTPDPATEDKL
jgi:hypothetical protein